MKELIRHILKEQSSKLELLKVIQNEDIFSAADLVGGINNLRQIFKDNTEIVEKLDSLKGSLNLIYHSRKEFREFPMKFEIIGKGVNTWDTNSWPIVNLIYNDSNLSYSEKKMFESFIYDTIFDLNVSDVDIKPEAMKMFKDYGFIGIDFVNGKNSKGLDNDIKYDDDDIKNLHMNYYVKSYMNESKILQENEDDPTKKILNFLKRRYKVDERDVGWGEYPIVMKSVTFEVDGERYGISKFQNKKEQISIIVSMLVNHEVIEQIDPYGRQLDLYTQKVIRAVKTFLNQVMV